MAVEIGYSLNRGFLALVVQSVNGSPGTSDSIDLAKNTNMNR